MANIDNEKKPTSVGLLLGGFFAAIGLGAILLSIGIISAFCWWEKRPLPVPGAVAIGSLVVGIVIDSWTVVRFWRRREAIFKQLGDS